MTLAEIGAAFAACNWWSWMAGMLLLGGDRITEQTLGVRLGSIPDPIDPATLGCIAALVRKAHSEPLLHAIPMLGGGWRVVGFQNRRDDEVSASGPTEAEAWLRAMQAA